MTSTKTTTTKANHYFRALVALAILASLLAVLAVRPAHADGEFIFEVNFTGDFADRNVGDGVCDVDFATGNTCTLRAAIQETNATAELDAIHFDIPEAFRDPGSGVATISPTFELPIITEPVVIEGYSQPGASVNTAAKGTNAAPKIVLSGANIRPDSTDGGNGLSISGGGTTIKGLVINDFKKAFNGGDGAGIRLLNVAGNTNNVISGNFIGTDAAGTAAVPNQADGVATGFNSTDNTIGGTTTVDRNLISGNLSSGVELGSGNNQVQNNLIGTDKTGTKALGNGEGVGVFKSGNTIGGGSPNTIAFNKSSGVDIDAVIGTSSVANRVLSNSIFSNGELGIDLGRDGVSANDLGDTDSGPNNLQNSPVISSAKTSSTATTISAKLNSGVNTPYIVQFFSNPAGTNEGKIFIGQKTVATNANGNVSFTFKPASKVAAGKNITATATRNFFSIPSDTSEFSAPRKVVAS
jgi:hypothetical protein